MSETKHGKITTQYFDKKGNLKKTEVEDPKPPRDFDKVGKMYEVKRKEEEKLSAKLLDDKEMIKNFNFAIKELPNSILLELIVFFEPSVVVKLISLYSGEKIQIPKIETIWSNYMKNFIKAALDRQNNKRVRGQLALKFGISKKRVSDIYAHMKKRKPPKMSAARIKKLNERVAKNGLEEVWRDLKPIVDAENLEFFSDLESEP